MSIKTTCLLLLAVVLASHAAIGADDAGDKAAGQNRTAVIIPFERDINPLSGMILKNKFREALDSGVDVVILDIYSPGGFTYVTFELMDMIMEAEDVETVAFVDREAISGAALMSLACDKIVMLPGATIGDAGEIVMGEDGAFRYTEAKSRSFLAQKVRTAAERTGRPVALAEKMTDKDMVVFEATHKTDGTIRYFSEEEWKSFKEADDWDKGKPVFEAIEEKFFTAAGTRAVELGFADMTIEKRADLAAALGVIAPIPIKAWTGFDTAVLILNTKVVAFLLIVIGLIALVFELSAPGVSIGGLISAVCFGLFFWSRFLGGTAGWLEVTLFVLGLLFIAAEVFVIPGFGVAGIGGIVLTLTALVMASRRFTMPDGGQDYSGLGSDVLTVAGAFAAFLIALVFLSNYLGSVPGLSRLTLQPHVAPAGGTMAVADVGNLPGWQRAEVGVIGVAASPLRPSGKVQIDNFTVDVVTEGDFVDSGTPVRVIAKQGSRVVVRTEIG